MKRLLVSALLATLTTVLHAGTMSYTANVSCSNCVTVSLSWASEPIPVFFVEVQDSLGDDLFPLNTGAPATTGAILPDPQTVSGLSAETMNIITNGEISLGQSFVQSNVSANLVLLDSNYAVIQSTPFVASLEGGVPEPAAWSLVGGGLSLLFLGTLRRRQNPKT